MTSWIEFWSRPNAVYANRRNLEAHFARLAADLSPHLPWGADRAVLDFGCGDALAAGGMAARFGRLYLYDAVPAVRDRLRGRYGGHPKITVLDEAGLAALPAGSIDMVLVISVVQYLDRGQLEQALADWRRLLKPDGRLLVADVIEPGTAMLRDVTSQLRFAAANGFLLPAVGALFRMFFSDYRRIRKQAGFSCYTAAEFLAILRGAGFEAEPLARNIGPTPHRRAFLARPAG